MQIKTYLDGRLDNFTDEDLKKELKDRRSARVEARMPKPLNTIDYTPLEEVAVSILRGYFQQDDFLNNKLRYKLIFDTAFVCMFGKDILRFFSDRVLDEKD